MAIPTVGRSAPSVPTLLFVTAEPNTQLMRYVRHFFEEQVAPKEGDQTRMISHIEAGLDRTCEVLYDQNRAIALLVYKHGITREAAPYDRALSSSVAIRALYPIRSLEALTDSHITAITARLSRTGRTVGSTALHSFVAAANTPSRTLFERVGFQAAQTRDCRELLLFKHIEHRTPQRIVSLRPPEPARSREPVLRQATLRKKYIHAIRNGQKTWEGRIHSGMFRPWNVGDNVRFFYQANASDDVVCKIVDKQVKRTFEEMIALDTAQRFVPEARDARDAVSIYHSIPGYTAKAAQHGVVAFRLEVIQHPTTVQGHSANGQSGPMRHARRTHRQENPY
jgi:ASC-1-like (ASCH) protein